MKRPSPISRALVLLFAAMGGACAVADSGAGIEGATDGIRKKPTANENWSSLTIQLPAGACLSNEVCNLRVDAPAMLLDEAPVQLRQPVRLQPGEHVLTVNYVSTKVTLAPGMAKTFTLAIARTACEKEDVDIPDTHFGAPAPSTFSSCPGMAYPIGTNWVRKGKVRLWASGHGGSCGGSTLKDLTPETTAEECSLLPRLARHVSVDGVCRGTLSGPDDLCFSYVGGHFIPNHNMSDKKDSVFAPGAYRLGYDKAETTVELREGDTKVLSLPLYLLGGPIPETFRTDIAFAEARELPDAATAAIRSTCAGDRSYALPADTTTTLKLDAFKKDNCVYTFQAGGRSITLDQHTKNVIELHRLDMDDVTVTRENGSTYTVRGTYELFFKGSRVAGPYKTNTGVDVLPGTYELVTSFSTVDGPQTQRETLVF